MLKPLAAYVRPQWFVLGEITIIVGLFLVYKYARVVIPHSDAVAFEHAGRVFDVERMLRLPSELHLQDVLLSNDLAVHAANAYYAYVHFPLTGLFLVWLFLRSRHHYLQLRTVLILMTGAALAIHTVFPLAPPRMFDSLGFVDTAAAYGPAVYHATPQADSLANQFAAMPSLHFGWAVVVAIGVIRASDSPRRWLWTLHPAVTLFVIVGTANHFWLDAAVAGMLVVLADHAVRRWRSTGRLARPIPSPRVLHGAVSGVGVPTRAGSRSPQPRSSSPAPVR